MSFFHIEVSILDVKICFLYIVLKSSELMLGFIHQCCGALYRFPGCNLNRRTGINLTGFYTPISNHENKWARPCILAPSTEFRKKENGNFQDFLENFRSIARMGEMLNHALKNLSIFMTIS